MPRRVQCSKLYMPSGLGVDSRLRITLANSFRTASRSASETPSARAAARNPAETPLPCAAVQSKRSSILRSFHNNIASGCSSDPVESTPAPIPSVTPPPFGPPFRPPYKLWPRARTI